MSDMSSPNNLRIRYATKEDLDDITTIARAGFPDDPGLDYQFPYRHEYPEDNKVWTRKRFEELLG